MKKMVCLQIRAKNQKFKSIGKIEALTNYWNKLYGSMLAQAISNKDS